MGKFDNAAVVIEQALDNCGDNGDLYYILSQIQKLRKANEEYIKNLGNAMKFYTSLSVPTKFVKDEMNRFMKNG